MLGRSATWLLTGIPRGGTSLCCRLAGDLPGVVALSEPLDRSVSGQADGSHSAASLIDEFVVRTRQRILDEGVAPSLHVGGRLDDAVVATDRQRGLRRRRVQRGDVAVPGTLRRDFTLVIKHNALFAALLPALAARYPCVAVVRNPVAVLASWQTVAMPVGRGRIPAGEQFDFGLASALRREPGTLRRQTIVLRWFFQQYRRCLPSGRVLRYEDVVKTGGGCLFDLLGQADAPKEDLISRNANPVYGGIDVDSLLKAALTVADAWSALYSKADCLAAAEGIAASS